jgi:hypothetical protein
MHIPFVAYAWADLIIFWDQAHGLGFEALVWRDPPVLFLGLFNHRDDILQGGASVLQQTLSSHPRRSTADAKIRRLHKDDAMSQKASWHPEMPCCNDEASWWGA